MRIPEKRLCDLCRGELTAPHVQMSYPLDEADAAALTPQLPKPPPNLFGFGVSVTPSHWRFEFCRGCAEGFMPMLAELKTQAIRTWLDERARRADAPMGQHDDV